MALEAIKEAEKNHQSPLPPPSGGKSSLNVKKKSDSALPSAYRGDFQERSEKKNSIAQPFRSITVIQRAICFLPYHQALQV